MITPTMIRWWRIFSTFIVVAGLNAYAVAHHWSFLVSLVTTIIVVTIWAFIYEWLINTF